MLVVVALLVAAAIAFLPTLFVTVAASVTPIGIAVVSGGIIALIVIAGCIGAILAPFLGAVAALQKLGLSVLVAVAIGLVVGLYGGAGLSWIGYAAQVTVYATVMGGSLLTPVAVRLSLERWKKWTKEVRSILGSILLRCIHNLTRLAS